MRDPRPRRRRLVLAMESLEDRKLLSGANPHPVLPPVAHVANLHQNRAPSPSPRRWAWLEDTYWYVPRRNLPATIFNPGSGALVPVRDQTVYHISGYRNGYFWGETVTQFGASAPVSTALVGSVTPEGRVLLSFSSASVVTQGYGEMTRKRGKWTMENQMFTGSSDGQIGHWAYMMQTRPGMKSWRSLPSVKTSVPTFLSHYSAPAPTPVF